MKVIPDSSFFICFLDDLEGHLPIADRIRILILIAGNFVIMVVPEVERESRLQRLTTDVSDKVQKKLLPNYRLIQRLNFSVPYWEKVSEK